MVILVEFGTFLKIYTGVPRYLIEVGIYFVEVTKVFKRASSTILVDLSSRLDYIIYFECLLYTFMSVHKHS